MQDEVSFITDTEPGSLEREHGGSVRFCFAGPTIDRSWLTPLLDAVASVGTNRQTWAPAKFLTKWDETLPNNESADSEKHTAYGEYMATVTYERMPWLISLLHAAGASVLFAPGLCTFTVPSRLGETFDIPELIPYSWLLPWREETDADACTH